MNCPAPTLLVRTIAVLIAHPTQRKRIEAFVNIGVKMSTYVT
jgi:hypothetical protein